MQRQPFVVGLTGGIASGKSTVANLFQNLEIDIIDADQLAREVVEPGQPALSSIVEHFGSAILQKDGTLDRAALKKIIFDHRDEKRYLEGLLHPLIRKQILKKLETVQSEYCLVVIPLLVETLPNPLVQRILVVDIPPERQKQFLIERDKLSLRELEKILQNQAAPADRLAKADDIIHNTGSTEALKAQVLKLHARYLEMSKKELNRSNAE